MHNLKDFPGSYRPLYFRLTDSTVVPFIKSVSFFFSSPKTVLIITYRGQYLVFIPAMAVHKLKHFPGSYRPLYSRLTDYTVVPFCISFSSFFPSPKTVLILSKSWPLYKIFVTALIILPKSLCGTPLKI